MDEIFNCDCIEGMRELPADSVDAIVTDPPYGLNFMGKDWDHGVPGEQFWSEALRVAKPGAHLLSFGGTRTYHRLACAIEDSGWEIRDCLGWLYGSGFPKSMDVSKAIDKSLGKKREVVGFSVQQQQQRTPAIATSVYGDYKGQSGDITSPASEAAKKWQGWGTALKPAWEPIIMARKPFKGTVAACVLEYGTGAINIDACRVAPTGDVSGWSKTGSKASSNRAMSGANYEREPKPDCPLGRFPANIIHDGSDEATAPMGDASRFFYCAKASKKDRGEGNNHPTVKPQALMQYLIKLVTPEGAVVLDPFLGSGSTAVAAMATGRHYLGYEILPEYFDIARARLDAAKMEDTL
jgi:site-specific DNA-methyltransferase (adenine-specific)